MVVLQSSDGLRRSKYSIETLPLKDECFVVGVAGRVFTRIFTASRIRLV